MSHGSLNHTAPLTRGQPATLGGLDTRPATSTPEKTEVAPWVDDAAARIRAGDADAEAAGAARESVLREALRLTLRDRNAVYGPTTKNFADMAALLSVMLGRPVTGREAVLAMVAAKLSRLQVSPTHRDTHVDLAAYAAILYEVTLDEHKNRSHDVAPAA